MLNITDININFHKPLGAKSAREVISHAFLYQLLSEIMWT